MKKKIKILNYNTIDSDGDFFIEGCAEINNPVLLNHNFDHNKPFGRVDVYSEKEGLFIEINSDIFEGLFPSIGFQIIKMTKLEGGINRIDKIKLNQVGLCEKPNIDKTIKPID